MTKSSKTDSGQGPLIQVENLDVRFDSQHVLRDITLDIEQGQALTIIGESGCGKTVLLKSIIGLIRPTQGKVTFDGNDLADLSEKQLTEQRLRFGFLFQSGALFDSMTVAQNVAFPLRQHRRQEDDEIHEIVTARLREVGLPQSVLSKKPAELSGGMRKRVGLARALAIDPEIMLYDEPTTGLDPIMSDVINELIIRTSHRQSMTSIVVTHDMHTVRKVASRVVMLYPLTRLDEQESQIVYDGPPDNLDSHDDRRVRQFVQGEAGERLVEMGETAAD